MPYGFDLSKILGPTAGSWFTPGSKADVYSRVPGAAIDVGLETAQRFNPVSAGSELGLGLYNYGRDALGSLGQDYDNKPAPGSLQGQMSMADATKAIHSLGQQVNQSMAPTLQSLAQQAAPAPERKPEDYSGVRAGAYKMPSVDIDTSNFDSMRDGIESNRYEMEMLGNSIDRREFDRNASMEEDLRRRAMEAKLDSLSPYFAPDGQIEGTGSGNDPYRNTIMGSIYNKGQVAAMEQERQKKAGQLELEVAKERAKVGAQREGRAADRGDYNNELRMIEEAAAQSVKEGRMTPEQAQAKAEELKAKLDISFGYARPV